MLYEIILRYVKRVIIERERPVAIWRMPHYESFSRRALPLAVFSEIQIYVFSLEYMPAKIFILP